ncbi:DUF2306 domain-containing protein [Acidobacteria bacterium AB60]|nr:DUF2306 domain-containing protein [Acidobacteria bacterium AB60]
MDPATLPAAPRFPLPLKAGFGICLVIAVAVVLRRAAALLASPGSSGPPQMADLDRWFATHSLLTWAHITCALALVLLLPFLFARRTRHARPLHSAFFLLGALTGLTAYAMSRYAVGGWLERSAVLFFDTAFLASLLRAYICLRRGDLPRMQQWTLRAVAILLGIATTRPVMAVFFATARLTHLTPHQFFGIAFWIGFSLNTLVIELWLRRAPAQPNNLP